MSLCQNEGNTESISIRRCNLNDVEIKHVGNRVSIPDSTRARQLATQTEVVLMLSSLLHKHNIRPTRFMLLPGDIQAKKTVNLKLCSRTVDGNKGAKVAQQQQRKNERKIQGGDK